MIFGKKKNDKVKVYRAVVTVVNKTSGMEYEDEYLVDAPNKLIAKWAAANIYNYEYAGFATADNVKVKRFQEGEDDDE